MPQLTDDQRAQLEAINIQKTGLLNQIGPIQQQVQALDNQIQELMRSFRQDIRVHNQGGPPQERQA
jgi:hypothetical protein